MAVIGSVLAEEHVTPDLLALFRELVVEPRREELRKALEHANERGEFGDVEAAVNMLVGSYAQYLAGGPLPEDWPEAVVETVVSGLRKTVP